MRLLSYDELRPQKGIPYSKVHLWRLEREGKFPKRVALDESRHGWLESEIDDWLAARAAERDGEPWEKIGEATQRVVESCSADIRDHSIKMQRELNHRREKGE